MSVFSSESSMMSEAAQTKVKLCGLSRDDDIRAAIAAAPDMVGFVVDFPRSHRNVSPARLVELCGLLGRIERETRASRIARVGVFVDEPIEETARIAYAAGLDAVQLHGSEDDAYIARLKSTLGTVFSLGNVPRIVQAVQVACPADVDRARSSPADLVLLDAGQGAGRTFDWSLVRDVGRPFLLAGGLGPENVARAIVEVDPWGVDMSSGVETNRKKDPLKMKAAVAAVRSAK